MQMGFLPDPALVKKQTRDLQADLDAWLKSDRAELETLLRESFRKTAQSEDPFASWDEVVQHYLAVHALVADRKPEIPAELRTTIEARLSCLRELLGFPEGYSSPAPFPAHSGSPDDARRIMKQLLDDVSRIPSNAN